MKLTDICDFQGGSQPPKEEWSNEKQKGYIRMLQIRDFTQSGRVTPEYIKLSKSNPYYLCAYTNLPHGKRQIDEGTGGAAQQHFNVGKYNKLQLMLPPIEKQDEFVLFMEQVDKSKF